MKKILISALVVMLLGACSTANIRPTVSLENKTAEQYEKDLLVCQQKAESEQSKMVKYAVIGAVVSSAITSLTGGDTKDAALAAAGGAAAGVAVDAVATGIESAEDQIKDCLAERGYQLIQS
jgi:uncharacterized protein YcfJ